jgi:hypothetical protein
VREAGVLPWRMATTRDALSATLAEVTAREAARRAARGHRARRPGTGAGGSRLPRRARRVVR